MFVGSFEGDFNQFQTDTLAAVQQFQASGVTRLLIDLTNNGGAQIEYLHKLSFDCKVSHQVVSSVWVNFSTSSLLVLKLAIRMLRDLAVS